MQNINITSFRKNVYSLVNQVIKYNESINVSTKTGNVVVLSAIEYNDLKETLYLSTPTTEKSLWKGWKRLLKSVYRKTR